MLDIDNAKIQITSIAKLAAKATSAHTVFVLLSSELLRLNNKANSKYQAYNQEFVLFNWHSLSNSINTEYRVATGQGFAGWVAGNRKPLTISPLNRDSKQLGLYTANIGINSLVAVPIIDHYSNSDHHNSPLRPLLGILICDSLQTYAFDREAIEVIEEVASQTASAIIYHFQEKRVSDDRASWNKFVRKTHQLIDQLGKNSLDVLRVKIKNFREFELKNGPAACIAAYQAFSRQIEELLPENGTFMALSNSDLVIVIDNMLSDFIEDKLLTIAKHTDLLTKGYYFSNRKVLELTNNQNQQENNLWSQFAIKITKLHLGAKTFNDLRIDEVIALTSALETSYNAAQTIPQKTFSFLGMIRKSKEPANSVSNSEINLEQDQKRASNFN
ncbi:MAG TPA: GAF domain-containing protein [Oligoflexia bacterium]|nr:GAF domain-containing protein [Oligoflexia bacterium]HMP26700.1 GAF domain-containing protein [Oligoflexia bacterium]